MTIKEFRLMYPGVAWDHSLHFFFLLAENRISWYKSGEIELHIVGRIDPAEYRLQKPGTRRLTVREYLQLIPDPDARERALKNCYKEIAGEWSVSLPKALYRAFLWHKSPEGFAYWNQVHDSLS